MFSTLARAFYDDDNDAATATSTATGEWQRRRMANGKLN